MNDLTELALTRPVALYLRHQEHALVENLAEYLEIQAITMALTHKLVCTSRLSDILCLQFTLQLVRFIHTHPTIY